jgi:hypothetical protein
MAPIDGTKKVVLFGGDNGALSDATWVFDYTNGYQTNNWELQSPANSPTARMQHSMASIDNDDKLLIFGGENDNTLNDTWQYDLSADNWVEITSMRVPGNRMSHQMALVYNSDFIVMMGGKVPKAVPPDNYLSDTWIFTKIMDSGDYVSREFDTGGKTNFTQIQWDSIEPQNSDIIFHIRTADNKSNLKSSPFVGPDGTDTSYFTQRSGEDIWKGHKGDRWIQYKAYFNTETSTSPRLKDVSIEYNRIPESPDLLNPVEDELLIDGTPTFSWEFIDEMPSNQKAFQVLIDDDEAFGSVNYDSGVQSMAGEMWHFPSGTGYTEIADGKWFWKVRTLDNDDDWSPYSSQWTFIMDTNPPNDFSPTAKPADWSQDDRPEITFNTSDDISGMSHYELKIDTGNFIDQVSPYTLPAQSDGEHNITVRAWDIAGHYIDRYVNVYVDTEPPESFDPVLNYTSWTPDTTPEITFATTDATSGVDHYEMSIDSGPYSIEYSPVVLEQQSEGEHDITLMAYDKAGNFIDSNFKIYIDSIAPSITHTPVTSGTKGYPVKFTAVVTDDHSGVSVVDLYYKQATDTSYSKVAMTVQDDTYSVELPSDYVTEDGLEYYIKAEDSSEPPNIIYYGNDGDTTIEPSSLTDIDIYITITDVTPPTITHIPITSITLGGPVTISATVTDDASGVDYVELYYRKKSDNLYTKATMAQNIDKYYSEIPGTVVTLEGIEYFIKAADKAVPANQAYFGAGGQVTEDPSTNTSSGGTGVEIVIEEKDTTPPSILEKSPIGNDISVGTTITITFSELMDETLTSSAFSIFPAVTGSTSWDGNKLIFTPDVALDYGTFYTISISIKAADISGNTLVSEYTWQFITTSTQDSILPIISGKLPEGVDIPVDTTITIAFSEPMIKEDTENAFSIYPAVPGIFNWVGLTLIFSPTVYLAHETQYQVTISTLAKDLVGNNLGSDYSWSFTTLGISDAVPPTVIYRVPFGVNIPVDSTITVEFDEPMLEQETKYAFSIYPSINGIFNWLGNSLSFTPLSVLDYNTTYHVTITTNAVDLAGNSLEQEYNWSFITEKAPPDISVDDPNDETKSESSDKSWDYWEPIVTILTILATALIGLIGFIRIRKRRSKLRFYFDKIDDTFNDYKKNEQICEKELVTLRENIKGEVKQGKIEEFHFLILDKKIDDYLNNMEASKDARKDKYGKSRYVKEKPIEDYAGAGYERPKADQRKPRVDDEPDPAKPYPAAVKNKERKIEWE